MDDMSNENTHTHSHTHTHTCPTSEKILANSLGCQVLANSLDLRLLDAWKSQMVIFHGDLPWCNPSKFTKNKNDNKSNKSLCSKMCEKSHQIQQVHFVWHHHSRIFKSHANLHLPLPLHCQGLADKRCVKAKNLLVNSSKNSPSKHVQHNRFFTKICPPWN